MSLTGNRPVTSVWEKLRVHLITRSISTNRCGGIVSLLLLSTLCVSNAHEQVAPASSARAVSKPRAQAVGTETQCCVRPPDPEESSALPPLPPGVTNLKFGELFIHPVGPRGLAFSRRAKELDGKRVRMIGYMVEQERPVPGQFLFCQMPMVLHEDEYGFCEDLPPTLVHVLVSEKQDAKPVPFAPGLSMVTGTLQLGNREEPDGRISGIRLRLEPPQSEGERQAALAPKTAAVVQSPK